MSSPDGSQIPPLTEITDDYDQIWTIGLDNHILINGTWAAEGIGTKILWVNRIIYVFGGGNNWFKWEDSAWINVGPQQPGPHPLILVAYWIHVNELQEKLDLWQGNIKFIFKYEQYNPNVNLRDKICIIVDES